VYSDKFDIGTDGHVSDARKFIIQWNIVANSAGIWGLHDVNSLLFINLYFLRGPETAIHGFHLKQHRIRRSSRSFHRQHSFQILWLFGIVHHS
jgi:hypothetical protein